MNEVKPVRIQRSRQHKQSSPNGLPIVSVSRPGKWGNPFKVVGQPGHWFVMDGETPIAAFDNKEDALDLCLALFREDILLKHNEGEVNIYELKDKNVSCWCKLTDKCHGDILLELTNWSLVTNKLKTNNTMPVPGSFHKRLSKEEIEKITEWKLEEKRMRNEYFKKYRPNVPLPHPEIEEANKTTMTNETNDPQPPVMVLLDKEGYLISCGDPDCVPKKELLNCVKEGGTVKTISYEEYTATKFTWIYSKPPHYDAKSNTCAAEDTTGDSSRQDM